MPAGNTAIGRVTGVSDWNTEKREFQISPESQNVRAFTSIPPTPFVALSAFPAAIGDLKTFYYGICFGRCRVH